MTEQKQPVVNVRTGKETRRTVENVTVTLTEKAGQVRFAGKIKMVYFSEMTKRWWFS